MSFTLAKYPNKITPAYNEMTCVGTSTNYNQPSHKYIFDLYVNSTLVNTSKLYPLTDGSVQYDPSVLIQDYLSYNFLPSLTGQSLSNSNEILSAYIVFKEEYMFGSTLVTYTLQTGETFYAWNAVAEFQEAQNIPSYVNQFIQTGTSAKFLNIKETNFTILDWENRNMSMFVKDISGQTTYNKVIITTDRGKQYTKTLTTGITTYDYINHFGIGLNQLNSTTWITTYTGLTNTYSYITPLEDSSYTVSFSGFTNPTLSISICKDTQTHKNFYTMIYRSKNGGWGYIPFWTKNYFTIDLVKEYYRNKLPYNYTSANFENKVYINESYLKAQLHTDFITTQEAMDEYSEMLQSPQCYLNMNNSYVPVIIENFTAPKPLRNINKTMLMTLNVALAYNQKNLK